MTKEQIKKQLQQMKEYMEAMKEEKKEASTFHEEDSEYMVDLDLDILLCSATINDLTRQLITKNR